MASDRGAVLTVRAAVRGVIDFSKARLLDPDWWRRCLLLLEAVAQEDELTVQDNIYRYYLALVANAGLTKESFESSQSNANTSFKDLVRLLRPWEAKSHPQAQQEEFEAYRATYEKMFGFDPTDRKEAERRVELWRQADEEERRKLSDEDRVWEAVQKHAEHVAALKRKAAEERKWRR